MKPTTTTLNNLLATRQFFSADLYHFALIGGGNLYYCGGDNDIVYGAHAYTAGGTTGPYFDRKDNKAKCHWKTGVEVDQLVFDVLPGASTIQGEPFLSAVRQGVFDGAELTLSRAFMPIYGDVADGGVVVLFVGRVAEIDAGRSLATFTVTSHLELLNQNMPRNLYQAGCVNTLYDASCGLNMAAFAVNGTATAGSTGTVIKTGLTTGGSGYYNLGMMTFTSGANNGVSRTVSLWVNGGGAGSTIVLISPFPNAPANGDGFTIYPGCNKTASVCAGTFGNLANFRGFPFVPDPATAV